MAYPVYTFALVQSSTLTPIGVLTRATERQISVGLNQAGDVSFSLSIFDRMADAIQPLSTAVIVYRNYVAIWSGPVISVVEDATNNRVRVQAKGWFHLLENRIMRMTTPANPTTTMSNPSFATNTASWRIMGGTGTITRDTSLYNDSPASGKLTPGGGIIRVQGEFANAAPAIGNEYRLTFWYRANYSVLADFNARFVDPIYSNFTFGSAEAGDLAVMPIPWDSMSNGTWYQGSLTWVPYTSGISWNTGTGSVTSYGTYPRIFQAYPGAAFRVQDQYFNADGSIGGPAYDIWVDSFTLDAKALPIIQKTYTATQACTIVSNIITDINADASSGITVGLAPSTVTRTRTYKKYDNVGRAIQELSDIENGFDWTINPTTKVLDMYSSRGSAKPNVHFGYRAGPDNLISVGRTIDASSLANYVVATGKYGSGISSDASSISSYGVYEDVVSIGDFASSDYNSTLLAVSGAEVLLRKQPRQIFSIVPKPIPATGGAVSATPEPFTDYDLGDTVYFSGKLGRLTVENQAVRVFGLSISIDDNGVERVGEIKMVYR